MIAGKPWITGAALAMTTALVDVICAVAVILYPDAVFGLANLWAHGLDFTLIRRAVDNSLTFSGWASGFVSSVAFGFVVGMAYRWSVNVLERFVARRSSTLLQAASHG